MDSLEVRIVLIRLKRALPVGSKSMQIKGKVNLIKGISKPQNPRRIES